MEQEQQQQQRLTISPRFDGLALRLPSLPRSVEPTQVGEGHVSLGSEAVLTRNPQSQRLHPFARPRSTMRLPRRRLRSHDRLLHLPRRLLKPTFSYPLFAQLRRR